MDLLKPFPAQKPWKKRTGTVLANPFSRLTKTTDFLLKFSVLRAGVLKWVPILVNLSCGGLTQHRFLLRNHNVGWGLTRQGRAPPNAPQWCSRQRQSPLMWGVSCMCFSMWAWKELKYLFETHEEIPLRPLRTWLLHKEWFWALPLRGVLCQRKVRRPPKIHDNCLATSPHRSMIAEWASLLCGDSVVARKRIGMWFASEFQKAHYQKRFFSAKRDLPPSKM